MSDEPSADRQDPDQPAIQPPLPVPTPRDPVDSTDLQVHVVSTAPLVVKVTGEIDIATGAKLREELLGAIRRYGVRLALDLGGVTFMDCAGINVLLAARRHARFEGGWVLVLRASRCVRKVLMLTGLHREFALPDPDVGDGPIRSTQRRLKANRRLGSPGTVICRGRESSDRGAGNPKAGSFL
jgi:anti-anti-sigma factor